MVHAFVLVDAAAGTAESVVEAARDVEGVEEAHVVAGDFDVVLEVSGPTVHDVLSTVTRSVRSREGVGTTRTYVSLG
jgi:DNA-binding Lrp family transcriptional regulator